MNGRFVISLCFMVDHGTLLSMDNITEIEALIDFKFPEEITDLISTNNWYDFTGELNVFDFLSTNIADHQFKAAIISKLCQIFPPHIEDDFSNDDAVGCVLKKHDDENYYSIVCPLDINNIFNDCNLVKKNSDYHEIHEKYLYLAPDSNIDYARRCTNLFDKIKFSYDFHETLSTLGNGQGIISYAEEITKVISTLNRINPETREIKKVMHWIHEESGFECSEQGKDKTHLFPKVTLDDDSEEKINCEFHIKINTRNDGGHIEYSRLYFGLMPYGQRKYSYIHHCGKHL